MKLLAILVAIVFACCLVNAQDNAPDDAIAYARAFFPDGVADQYSLQRKQGRAVKADVEELVKQFIAFAGNDPFKYMADDDDTSEEK